MAAKIEKKNVTYSHEVDSMHKESKELTRTVSVQPVESTGLQDANRLKIEYNVGKRPETKGIQGLK